MRGRPSPWCGAFSTSPHMPDHRHRSWKLGTRDRSNQTYFFHWQNHYVHRSCSSMTNKLRLTTHWGHLVDIAAACHLSYVSNLLCTILQESSAENKLVPHQDAPLPMEAGKNPCCAVCLVLKMLHIVEWYMRIPSPTSGTALLSRLERWAAPWRLAGLIVKDCLCWNTEQRSMLEFFFS